MNYNIIGSSSKGNCIIVEDILMLDCGMSYIKIKKYLKKVKLIFISHSHKDHINPITIKLISENNPIIKFVCGGEDVVNILVNNGIALKNIYILKTSKWYNLGAIKVCLEELNHDVFNCSLKWNYKNKKGIYIVDTNKINHITAKNYDLYLIENNYRDDILKKHIDECEDVYKLNYLKRVPETHLSDEKCNNFLMENLGDNSVFQYIHQSQYNYEERD